MNFGYCEYYKSGIICTAMESMLPEGIKVLEIANGTMTLQRMAANDTKHHFRAACIVHSQTDFVAGHFYDVDLSKKCKLS